MEGNPLLEPLPGVVPADKGSIWTNKRGLLEAFDLPDRCFPLSPRVGQPQKWDTCLANKNIRHQSDWSKVSLYPSPSFLAKNLLAKEGPDSVAPVVIPVLAPTLDKSLKSTCATIWTGHQTSGRTRSWSLSPLRKVLTRTTHLPLSPHGSTDCDPMLWALWSGGPHLESG